MSRRSRHHSSNRGRDAACLVLSFFLSLALVVELLLLIAYVGFFSEKGFVSVLDDDYYQYTLDYINQQAEYYTVPTGYGTSVLEGVFRYEEVRGDVGRYVSGAFRGNEFEPDETAQRSRIAENVRRFYENNGGNADEAGDEIINSYADEVMKIYRNATKMPGLDTIARFRNRLIQLSLIAAIVVGVLAMVLTAALARSHHYVHRGLRYVAYATGGAALISFVAPCALYLSGFYKGLGLAPKFFYHFGISLIERILFLCMGGGFAFLFLTILLIAIISRKRIQLIGSSKHRAI